MGCGVLPPVRGFGWSNPGQGVMEAVSVAVLSKPPNTDDHKPFASLALPPNTEEVSPLAVPDEPPDTDDPSP